MEEELLKKIDEISDEMISGIKRIVQIDSVQSEAKLGMPFGEGVNKALEEALKLASELGFETETSIIWWALPNMVRVKIILVLWGI